eukprot:Nk52_evm2s353 gene=Nk52_evmTU2s353
MLKKLKKAASTATSKSLSGGDRADSECFELRKSIVHGIPPHPTALAYDPLQSLIAVGTDDGIVKIFGMPGVERSFKHEDGRSIMQLLFVEGEGILISVTVDSVNYWDLKSSEINLKHKLQFSENICFCHTPTQSFWMYVGTTRGNLFVVDVNNFELSEYMVYWNHLVEISDKNHPGAIISVEECPMNDQLLLIGFEKGVLVLWDVKEKKVCKRFGTGLPTTLPLTSVCWYSDGKQFITSHSTGPMRIWNLKNPEVPEYLMHPMPDLDDNTSMLSPVGKVLWVSDKDDAFFIHSGGTFRDSDMDNISIKHKKVSKELFFENEVVDFLCINSSPWSNDTRNPVALVVLLANELVVCDVRQSGFPTFRSPFGLYTQNSPVTCVRYYTDVKGSVLTGLRRFGHSHDAFSFSTHMWPVTGGVPGEEGEMTSNDIIVTGHEDGRVLFWDASTIDLLLLCTLDCKKMMLKSELPMPDDKSIFCFEFCPMSRLLSVGLTSGEVLSFVFSASERDVIVRTCTVEVVPLKDRFSGCGMKEALSAKSVDITETSDCTPPKDKLEQLQRLGFNIHWCELALQKYNCDMNLAAAFLFDHGIPLGEKDGDLPPSSDFIRNDSERVDVDAGKSEGRAYPETVECSFDLGFQLVSVAHNVQKDTTMSMGPLRALAMCSKYNVVAYADLHTLAVIDLVKSNVLYAAPLAAFDGKIEPHQSSESKRISTGNLTLDDYVTSLQFSELYLSDSAETADPCLVAGSVKGGVFFYKLKFSKQAKGLVNITEVACEYYFYDRGNIPTKNIIFFDKYGRKIEILAGQWTDDVVQIGDPAVKVAERKASLVSQKSDAALVAPPDLQEEDKKDEKKGKTSKSALQTMVSVGTKRIRTFNFPSKHFKIEKAEFESYEVIGSFIIPVNGDSCLYCFFTDGHIRIYSLPEIKPLFDCKVGVRLDKVAVCEDGRFCAVTGNSQVVRYSSIFDENFLNLPFSLGSCHVEEIDVPSRPVVPTPKGFLKTVMNVVTVGSTNAGDSDRDELFKSDKKKTTYVAKRVETKAERQEKARRMEEIASTGNALGEAGRRLNERTDKLDQMTDTTEQMKLESKKLNSNARALREKMEKKNKNWWHF